MAAQAALIADTIAGMKRAISGLQYCEWLLEAYGLGVLKLIAILIKLLIRTTRLTSQAIGEINSSAKHNTFMKDS